MGCGLNPICHVSSAAEDVADTVGDLGSAVGDALADAFDETGDLLGAVGGLLVDALEEVGEGFIAVGDALGEGIAFIGDAIIDGGKIVSAKLLNAAGDLVGWVIDGIIWMLEVVGDVAEVAAQALVAAGQFAFDAITLNKNIFDNLVANLEEFAGDFLRLYETTVKGLFTQLQNLYEMTIGQGLGLIASVLDYIPVIGELLGNGVRILNDSVGFVMQLVETIVALPTMLACQYTDWLQEDPELENLIALVLDSDAPAAVHRRVQRLPCVSSTVKYAIFSDLHRFVPGDTDFFTKNGTPRIYRSLMRHLSVNGYTLIENGDVEDLWRRDSGNPAIDNSLGAGTPTTNRTLLRSILFANRSIYDQIEDEFASSGKYARTAGNHDLPMVEPYMQRVLQNEALPSAKVAEFLVIEGKNGGVPTHLIAHGHQSDNFNRAGCEWFGESVTRLVSRFFQLPLIGKMIEGLSSGEPNVDEQFTRGRKNILDDHEYLGLFATLDEPELFAAYERLAGNIPLPWLLLGHSHDPKWVPGIKDRSGDCADNAEPIPPAWGPQPNNNVGGYLNTGTTGMLKDIVWFATIQEDGQGNIATLLNSARLDSANNRVLIRTYQSVAPCVVLPSGDRETSQWLSPVAASENPIPAL